MRAPVLPPPQPRTLKRKRRKSLLLGLLGFAFAGSVLLVVVGSLAAGYILWQASQDLPSYDRLAQYEPPVMSRIHANDGALIAEYARERRIFVPINTVPKLVIGAYLSAEDKRFYEHGGLDFVGIMRAVVRNLQNLGGRAEGASTITQQVAKNFLLTSERHLDRKLKEAILAIRIERAYTKDKILELYLNEIYLGIGSYGVAAAALNYFSKELKDLEPHEAAYLASLPKAPNNYHPFRQTNRALARRNWVLMEMVENGYITQEQAEAAKAKPLGVNLRPFGAHIFAAEYFAEEVRRTLLARFGEDRLYGGGMSVRTTLDPTMQQNAKVALVDGLVKFDRSRGWRGPTKTISVTGDWGAELAEMERPTDIDPWRLGVVLKLDTTKALVGLRPDKLQGGAVAKERTAVHVMIAGMSWAGRFVATDKPKGRAPKRPDEVLSVGDVIYVAPDEPSNLTGNWSLMQVPDVGGGIVAMDPHTGRVLAVVGGFSFSLSQFDRAMQARRQPGSSFKPLVYAAALDNGYKPTSIVLDAPIEIEQGAGRDVWRPENYNRSSSLGPATLRTGIEKSRNQMTVRLAQDMGMPLIIEYSKRFGVYNDLLPVLAMSLGAGETTLLRMVNAYAMLANGGKQVEATLIDRIQDRWGKTIWRHDQRTCAGCASAQWSGQDEPDVIESRRQIIDPHTAYQMTSILTGVVDRGTATIIKRIVPGVPLAGKTGTTNDSKDTWFVGYSADLVVGVYVGYDNPQPMGKSATGGQIAAPIFGEFMKAVHATRKPVPFRIPPGIQLVAVDRNTGLKAAHGSRSGSLTEAFKPFEGPDDANSFLGYEGSDPAGGGGSRSFGPGRTSVY